MRLFLVCISEEDDVVQVSEHMRVEPQTRETNISERVSNKNKQRKQTNE